jgi:hypothetical protein
MYGLLLLVESRRRVGGIARAMSVRIVLLLLLLLLLKQLLTLVWRL